LFFSHFQNEIKDAMGISTYQFANLYAWYSWPNVILPIVGGYLMDSVFGIRLGTIIFAVFIIIGQVIFATGGLVNSYPLMQIGRFVFGIGGESLAVAQNTYAVSWFKGKELNMVFGFQVLFIGYFHQLTLKPVYINNPKVNYVYFSRGSCGR
jgi:MFS family permease